MNHQAFQASRQQLGRTQKQLSELLGTSLKSIQSFEQGWRNVPIHIERQVLFLLTLKNYKARQVLVYQRDHLSGKTEDQLEQQDEGVPEM